MTLGWQCVSSLGVDTLHAMYALLCGRNISKQAIQVFGPATETGILGYSPSKEKYQQSVRKESAFKVCIQCGSHPVWSGILALTVSFKW